jgi:spoIIIJ-associated protein
MEKDKIKKVIEDIFNHTACTISSCSINEEDGSIWCSIETPDSRFLIGHEGETLRSLNHLVRRMLEKDLEEGQEKNVFIDINGYQKKRFDNLKNIAHMMAERARYFKSSIEIDPMPAFERRIIHTFLENAPNIKTESEGFGSKRRVVVKYIDNI